MGGDCCCTSGTQCCSNCGYTDDTSTYGAYNNNCPSMGITQLIEKCENPLALAIIENNIYNKSMYKYIKALFETLEKKPIRLIIPVKKRKFYSRQNVGATNFKKVAA